MASQLNARTKTQELLEGKGESDFDVVTYNPTTGRTLQTFSSPRRRITTYESGQFPYNQAPHQCTDANSAIKRWDGRGRGGQDWNAS